ncbi:phenylalanine--tRNA ligase subunit beta [Desulfococcaceae bacterium HSG8]|nr:phenylalanine--tRNA ligase subunit beta [Desulfococcaceae bacterium HSG8]
MKVSLSWLKDYVPVETGAEELADALTMAGLEVETISDRYAYLDTVLVGRIVKISPHPNADKLRLCEVDAGDRTVSVVCGAPNVAENMFAPLALPGTVFPDGTVLEKSVIRGQTSEGMLCSEAELCLGSDQSGLMSLDPALPAGAGLADALGLQDKVFELGLTPNRPDCLSIIGIAREVAAIQNTGIKYPESGISDAGDEISGRASVTIDAPDHCPRYAARLVENIKIGPSPFWLQEKLMSVGLRPISNIVDITNFVMMEMGQPLHAFDFDRLAGHRIVVRTAAEGETFTTLDDKERALSSHMLMICDGERSVAVGGVMGGLNSEIEDNTTNVLIESAYFSPVSIRKTSKKLGLSTDASYRFERGVDPGGTVKALNRAAQLMVEIGGGRLVDGLIDEHPKKITSPSISLDIRDANRVLGTALDQDEAEALLKSIEFEVEKTDADNLLITPPSFRVDVSRPADLMEEIARLSGYNGIPTTFPAMPAEARKSTAALELRNRVKGLMTGFGFTEAVNYSFMNKDACDRLRLGEDDPGRRMLDIMNPLTEEQTVMRTSLIPGLLETAYRNIARQVRELKLFEIGKVFITEPREDLPKEPEMFVALRTGARSGISWHSKEASCDFYDIKGLAEGLIRALNISNLKFTRMPDEKCFYLRPGHTARILAGSDETEIGVVGEVHPEVVHSFDLKQKAFVFELSMESLAPLIPEVKQSEPIPRYPSVSRDITVIVNKDIEAGRLLENVGNIGEKLMEDVRLFDVYEGDPVPAGSKSISFRITYRSPDRTLEDEEVTGIHRNITDILVKEFDAGLPA